MIEELNRHPYLVYGFLSLFFMAIGSLLNVIIYRLPLMLKSQWREQCCELLQLNSTEHTHTFNLFFPRSFCPHCKQLVKAWQNIPLLNYLYLRGRCYHCHKAIGWRYPFVELLTLILSLYACWHFGLNLKLVFVLAAIYLLICMFFIDSDHQLIPDSLSLSLLWLGLIANTQGFFTSSSDAIFSAVVAYLSLWLVMNLYFLFTGKTGMGNGDFKLFAALGAWFGWALLPINLLIASISGILVGLFYLLLKRKPLDTRVAFGPFLCVAGLISFMWGPAITHWYLG